MDHRSRLTVVLIVGILLLAGCNAAAAPSTTPAPTDSEQSANPTDAPADFKLSCTMTTDQLPELSGLTSSILHSGILWAHNDSGDTARIFAIDSSTCQVKAIVQLGGVVARDVEAIATGRAADGTPVIWLGDIGDNNSEHSSAQLYRINEPEVLKNQTVPAQQYRFTYADGATDAEGLLVDPTPSGRMWVVSKKITGGAIYALPENFTSKGTGVATKLGPAPTLATDASYAPDGENFIIRTYFGATLYVAPPPGSANQQVALPGVVHGQVQGEAIAFSQDSKSIFVASEKSKDLFRVALP